MSRLGVASFVEHRVLTADVQTLQFIFYWLTGNLTEVYARKIFNNYSGMIEVKIC
jgi:hypothetical protein